MATADPSSEQSDTPERSPEQLMKAYRAGQSEAFETLVRRFHPDLVRFLIRFVNSRAAAEDLFQETFLQVHISADTFDPSKRFKPWLFTIAANKARDYLRKHKRHRAAPLSAPVAGGGEGGPSFVDLMEADIPLPTQEAQEQETRQLVREVVAQMPDHLREVLVLAYFNHMPYKEIASVLTIPLGTVKSRLHAAVGAFAQQWKAKYEARSTKT